MKKKSLLIKLQNFSPHNVNKSISQIILQYDRRANIAYILFAFIKWCGLDWN